MDGDNNKKVESGEQQKNNMQYTYSNLLEAGRALTSIREKYDALSLSDIENFAPVYYPIAIVEMDMDETTFEDFESVQYFILKMVDLGITDCNVMADTLGVSYGYIFKVFRLLNGYGHIDENGITPLGQESIQKGKKVGKARVLQRFQLDALNGNLLKIEQIVDANMLKERNKTAITIGHLDYLDGVSVREISSQIANNKIESYVTQKDGILNTNVTNINDVRCVDIKYAHCYMMKLKNCDNPIVFARRYDESKKNWKDRMTWKPLGVSNQFLIDKYGFEVDVPINSVAAKKYINQLYETLLERAEEINLVEEIKSIMSLLLDERGIRISKVNGMQVPAVYIDEQAFKTYNKWMIELFVGIANNKEYLLISEKLYGYVISVRTESEFLIKVAELVDIKVKNHGIGVVINRVKYSLKNCGEGDFLTAFVEGLEMIKD